MGSQRKDGVVAIITALGTLVGSIGTVIVIIITATQGKTLDRVERIADTQSETLQQVELQGNSRELEVKRLIMVAYQRLAQETKKPEDVSLYQDALKSYEAAKRALERADSR